MSNVLGTIAQPYRVGVLVNHVAVVWNFCGAGEDLCSRELISTVAVTLRLALTATELLVGKA